MNEKPILFSGPMVRAILEGRKTQTRRIVKPQPFDGVVYCNAAPGWAQPYVDDGGMYGPPIECPYGEPGARLWVRETWRDQPGAIEYRADTCNDGPADGSADAESPKWRPSIFMPRAASRITLEITAIRVERLQDITEEDAEAEGIEREFRTVVMRPDGGPDYHIPLSYRGGIANKWDEINGKRASWDSNPWVWVVEFNLV